MSRNGKFLLLVSLVLANVALLTYIGFRKSAASTTPAGTRKEIDKLPAVEVVDDTGRRFALGATGGRVLVVQFITRRSPLKWKQFQKSCRRSARGRCRSS